MRGSQKVEGFCDVCNHRTVGSHRIYAKEIVETVIFHHKDNNMLNWCFSGLVSVSVWVNVWHYHDYSNESDEKANPVIRCHKILSQLPDQFISCFPTYTN